MSGTIPERLGPVVGLMNGVPCELFTVQLEDLAEWARARGLVAVGRLVWPDGTEPWPPMIEFTRRTDGQ